jgi:hypothetical protein
VVRVLWGLSLAQFKGPPIKKKYKITNIKLGTKVNIYLGPFLGPCKGPLQVRGPKS